MERIKGDISLVCSEGFESNRAPKLDQQYNGRIEVYVKDSDFAKFCDEKVGGKLNPTWVEWLMGWPLEWTDLKPLETDKSHCVQQQHGKS